MPRLHPGSPRSHHLRCSRACPQPAVAGGDYRKVVKPASREKERQQMSSWCRKEEKETQGEGEEAEKVKTGMQSDLLLKHPNTMFAAYA